MQEDWFLQQQALAPSWLHYLRPNEFWGMRVQHEPEMESLHEMKVEVEAVEKEVLA